MLAALLYSACGESEPPTGAPTSAPRDLVNPDAPFVAPEWRHPFTEGLQLEGIAFYEAKVNAEGKPFAIVEQERHDEDGTVHRFSGVTTIDSEPMNEDELEEARRAEVIAPRVVHTAPKIGDELLNAALALEAGRAIPVSLYLHRPSDYMPLVNQLERAIALGEVLTLEDRYSVRQRLLSEQQTLVAREMARARAAVEALGGRVTYQCRNLFCMEAELTADQIFLLQDEPSVARMDAFGEIEENSIRGREVSAGTQMQQFQDENYLGDNNSASLGVIRVGVAEHSYLDLLHVGYREGSGTLGRVAQIRTCNSSSCAGSGVFSPPYGDHPTAVAGIALGDLTDGQDSTITNADDRIDRSGFAREGELYFWRAESDSAIAKVLDDVADSDIPVLNMSISVNPGDSYCLGETTTSRAVNTLYETGTLTFFASGNNGHDSTTNCVVEEPGSAISAFVVGGHTNNASTNGETEVRSGPIWRFGPTWGSDRGGCSLAEGKWRSIIDLTAPACRMWVFNETGGYDQIMTDANGQHPCATSWAAPTVTGAAVEFIDYYRNERSSAIDDPGRLTANMLLMGDRQAVDQYGNNFKAAAGFSNLWGAGRMKLRKFDDAGMDWPWAYGEMTTCIDQGENYYYPSSNGMLISSNVNAFKAVLNYYDWRHEEGTSIDRVSLTLQRKNTDGTWSDLNTDAGSYEEKKRVFYSTFYNNTYYRIRIQGQNVTWDSGYCGTDSMRVHLAYFYEDSARDDADGPDGTIDTE
jgi:hypothetical protein